MKSLLSSIEIRCNHALLKGLPEKDLSDLDNPRMARIFKSILHYDYQINHVNGHQNQVEDCISRQYLGESEIEDFQVNLHDLPNGRIMGVMTRKGIKTSVPRDIELVAVDGKVDPEYKILLECVRNGNKPSNFSNEDHPFRVIEDKHEGMSIVETN